MLENEQAIIQRVKQGDHQAMEILFRTHLDAAIRLAYLITRDWTSAEDAVQEGFIQAFRSINNFKDGLPFKPWFTKIVVNKAKRIKEKFGTERQIPASNYLIINDPASPEEISLDKEKEQALYNAINQLDEKHRLPIILKYLNELSEAETAQVLDLPVSTVKSRLYVARQRLKKHLIADQGGVSND
ncbi:MAG: sigma-70 family RNA polymerase sigma factor [Firmicutes bacterium]|nr:sigma-70 family RNA polymerase sigma factor [Bacillota bacterium]